MPNVLTIWAIRARHFLSHVFEYWLWRYRYFEVKLTFEMLTVRGQQHSFSTHERMFLWKCQSFWDRKYLDLRGIRTHTKDVTGMDDKRNLTLNMLKSVQHWITLNLYYDYDNQMHLPGIFMTEIFISVRNIPRPWLNALELCKTGWNDMNITYCHYYHAKLSCH